MKKKQSNERRLKRARRRAIDFKSKAAIFIIAGKTCEECLYNSKNEEKLPVGTWSMNYDPNNKKHSPYCKRYLRPYHFPKDQVCHMFEEDDNVRY